MTRVAPVRSSRSVAVWSRQTCSTPVVESLDLHALGRHEVGIWSESLRRLIEFRDAGREDRFFDVMFVDVQADPVAAMERLYAEMGDVLTDATRARMAEWWAGEAADRRQGPRPDPAAYGLDVATLRDQFAFYHDRFDIPVGAPVPTRLDPDDTWRST